MSSSRSGVHDRATSRLRDVGYVDSGLVHLVVQSADVDTTLDGLEELVGVRADLPSVLAADEVWSTRLVAALGVSRAVAEFWRRHPECIDDVASNSTLVEQLDEASLREFMSRTTEPNELRVGYQRVLAVIAALDAAAELDFAQTSRALSDIAVATLDAALAIAKRNEPDSASVRLTVMAMGKTGGHELNYISDVDVIFVHDVVGDFDANKANQIATRLATAVITMCGEHSVEGTIWEVDPNLRPEGKNGPLTRTLTSHIAYYQRWASTWEFQALLKARFAAGDRELAADYLAALQPMVWEASRRDDFVKDVRAMRARVIDNIPAAQRGRQLKLGSGGLRDVEFAVQLLQLVHGRADAEVRSPNTLRALQALTERGYVGRDDGAALAESYEFLRTFEHRIQMYRMQRTHLVPEDSEDLTRIGRSMGFNRDSAHALTQAWQEHRRVVSSLHEKIFFRPLLEAVAAIPTDDLTLSTEAAEDRFYALGYRDPKGAIAHIASLTAGVSRRASIQKSLLPAMLQWFSESPNPDAGLLAFRRISDELGDSHWYLRKLRDEGSGAQQLAKLLSSSAYVTDLIVRAPDSVAMLGEEDEFKPLGADALSQRMSSAVKRHHSFSSAIKAIRRVRRRELARISMSDVLGSLSVAEVGEALSALTSATLEGALAAAESEWRRTRGELPTRMAIVLMGRLGGHEMGYSSDADVMFVHDPTPEIGDAATAAACAQWMAQHLRASLAEVGQDPPLEVDADLRPEGKNGPLVRTLSSYAAYYAKWSDTWEAQALLRAEAVVGDADVCDAFTALVNPLRYPSGGLDEKEVREIRRIKARVETERLPRGADPATHLKLGRGGLADVEWTIQLLQMQYAHDVPGLRTTRTLDALDAAAGANLLSHDDVEALKEAWIMVSRIRNGVVLWRNKPAESLVTDPNDLVGVAHVLGLGQENSGLMVNDYKKATRLARKVVEKVFYG
uniref:Glutamate-ammonia-ligase adenylyltransferase n=1 Tax=uncultured bacterium A1Q1_fos_2059 TaxID=1256559 RepID=L7VTM2_9BACT|nr:glutamate-ammonia-ligase adenylyltransferase [uncultured bacterium A1Q1_fos_2059]